VTDAGNLERFVDAQAHTYEIALNEIIRGRKTSHWMWFVFPQLRGLGSSAMAQQYGLASLDEARAFLAHPVLSRRLGACVAALQDLPRADAEMVFGSVDAIKLRSSLTLFIRAGGGSLFEAALDRWFSGQADERTDELLERARAELPGVVQQL
jgi:uncharacterized protein (DUF1810 family)